MRKSEMSRRRSIIIYIAIITSIVMYSCVNENNNSGEKKNAGTPVTITHPYKTSVSDYIELNGNTTFLTKEILRATFQGFIEKVYKNIGDRVERGDDIFQIKTMESAAADSLNVLLGNKEFKGSVILKAQSDGVLTQLDYHQGDFISSGEQLGIIANPSSLRIDVNVPFEDISDVSIGRRCEVYLPGGKKLEGEIDSNIPSVDSAAQTQTYYIKLIQYKPLPENLNVTVKIPFNETKDALVLPNAAILANVTQDSFWVMKVINDTTAIRTDVEKGIANDSVTQVVNSRLKAGDRIVLNGAYGLPDTAKIELRK
jgi:multidrug efflux pump subunit AcrA (membrane-fusion protein)